MVALPVLYLSRNHSESIEIRKLFAVFATLMHVALARNCTGGDVSLRLTRRGPIVHRRFACRGGRTARTIIRAPSPHHCDTGCNTGCNTGANLPASYRRRRLLRGSSARPKRAKRSVAGSGEIGFP